MHGRLKRIVFWTAAALSVLAPGAALSQSAPSGQPQAAVSGARLYTIAAGPLAQTLNRFAEASHLQLIYSGEATRGRQSGGLSGVFTRQQALEQLLAGSGLAYRFTSANTVTIERPGANATGQAAPGEGVQLDTVEVYGDDQSPYGPGVGYVATRSTAGTKTNTPIIETPQSISVVTRQQMDDRNVQTLNDALRYVSGVQAGDTGDLTTESFAIRGYNAPYLSLYRDGMRAMFRAFDSVAEPYGLERVEVLKGPASVLYGQGVPGGIVNLVTKRPTETTLREVQLQAGTFNRLQTGVDVGGPVPGNDNILYRLTFLGRNSDTQIDYVPDDRIYIAPALTLRSDSRDTTFTLLTNYQRDWTSFPDGVTASGTLWSNPNGKIPSSRFTGEPDWSMFNRTSWAVGYIFDHAVTDAFSIHQDARYTNANYERRQVQNRGLIHPQNEEIARRARHGNQDSGYVEVDTRGEYKFETGFVKHNVLAGVDYTNATFRTQMTQGNIAPLNLFNPEYGSPVPQPDPVFNDRENAWQTGLYLQEQAKLWDRLILLGGVRYDWANDKFTDYLAGGKVKEQEDEAFTYRLGAIYELPAGFAPYASYTQSFLPLFGRDANRQFFKPETAEQYEIGLKYQPPGSESFVTLSAFHLVRENVQTPTPTFEYIQTGEVTTKGVELEGVANLTREINVIGTVTWNDAEVTKSSDVDLGQRPVTMPDFMASLWVDYAFKSGQFDGLSFGAGVRYIGDTPGDMANRFFVPGYAVVDAAIRYEWKNVRFAVNANNIFDKEYISTCFSVDSCYFGGRRTVLGTVTYKW